MIDYVLSKIDGLEGNIFYSPLFGKCKYIGCKNNEMYFTYAICGELRTVRFDSFGRLHGTLIREDLEDKNHFKDEFISEECLIFPSETLRDWSVYRRPRKDLDINTLVFYRNVNEEWKLGYYQGNCSVVWKDQSNKKLIENVMFIVPFDKLNTTDLSFKSFNNYGTTYND